MSKKLMIVDDSRVVYASMSKMLENSGGKLLNFAEAGRRRSRPTLIFSRMSSQWTSLCRGWMVGDCSQVIGKMAGR